MNCHIIHKSAAAHHSALDALPMINSDDVVIFIDDGIYNAIHTDYLEQLVAQTQRIFALSEHALARGFSELSPCVEMINMPDFVRQSLSAEHNISWY